MRISRSTRECGIVSASLVRSTAFAMSVFCVISAIFDMANFLVAEVNLFLFPNRVMIAQIVVIAHFTCA